MSTVFIVESENGCYSMYESIIEGVFATYDRAAEYIKEQKIIAYHHVGELINYRGWVKPFDSWSTSDRIYTDESYEKANIKLVETVELIPQADNDGSTFVYKYPNGENLNEWVNTYIIVECEVIE